MPRIGSIRRGVAGGVSGEEVRAGLAAVEELDNGFLEAWLRARDMEAGVTRPIPDCARIDLERRRVGVTLELLHLECVDQNPDGYVCSQFCAYYRWWLGRNRLSMRQVYRAGWKGFVVYSSKRPWFADAKRGEKTAVELSWPFWERHIARTDDATPEEPYKARRYA